ncbi:MAG TPA: hypothetical protein VHG51_08600 [Longimicrobiaceae bacterium]|nr:hypothetical protein [Longimicrobiaceae bacterium]
MNTFRRSFAALAGALALAACDGDSPFKPELGFLAGTEDDQQIGVVVNSTERALTLFQLGAPREVRQVALGSSSQVTPVGASVRGRRAAVPLGNAASVALVDLEQLRATRYFLARGGNLTGSAWVDDRTVLVANTNDDYVGRFTVDQAGDSITQRVQVASDPTEIVIAGDRALVVSSNLGPDWMPLGNGVVTALNPGTLQVLGTVQTGGTNPGAAALGPDGLLYVVNTGDYASPSVMTVLNPQTLAVVRNVPDVGTGAGSISIGRDGLAYISGFFVGTVVYDTRTRTFVRGPDDPVCAKLANGQCRGAADAQPDEDGNLYQVFFGSAAEGLAPYVFVYRPGTFQLADSVAVGQGPSSIDIRTF